MNLGSLLIKIQEILNATIPVLILLGLVFFIWGVLQYAIGGGEEAKKKGKATIVYGIIGLTVIVGIWGIVNLVIKSFGLESPVAPIHQLGPLCNYSGGLLGGSFQHFAGYINCTIKDSVIPFIFAVAIGVFIWGVVKFFFINSDEEAKRTEGKQFMIWGLLALTVMLSVWGLVSILQVTFGINPGNSPYGLPQTRE